MAEPGHDAGVSFPTRLARSGIQEQTPQRSGFPLRGDDLNPLKTQAFKSSSPSAGQPAYSRDPRRLARALPEWVPATWAGSGACGAALPEAAPREVFANGCLPEARARRKPALW